MSETEAKIAITADASGVAPGIQQAGGEIKGLEPMLQQLNAQFAELAATIRESMTRGATGSAEMAAEMRLLEAETEKEVITLKEMVVGVHEGVESFNKFKAALAGIAEVWMAAFAVESFAHWSESMGEAAEKVEHLSQRMGMTISQVREMQGVATGTGISVDALARGLAMMDNRAVTSAGATNSAAKAFEYLGISANDGRSNMERLILAADKFHDLPDGPNKTALAMQAFGRSGTELIPILNLGSQGIEELISRTKEYGLVNDEAIERGVKLAEAVNENKIAWEGLKTTLMDEFAPALTAIADHLNEMIAAVIHSYEEGGTAKRVFDSLLAAGQSIAQVFATIGPIFLALAENIKLVTSALEALIAVMIIRYAAGAVAAVASSALVSTAIFAIEAASAGAATALEALALVAGTAGRALLAAFGGPIGIAIAVLTAVIYECATSTDEAASAAKRFADAEDEARSAADKAKTAAEELATATGEARKEAEADAKAQLQDAEARLKNAQAALAAAQMSQRKAQQTLEHDQAVQDTVNISSPTAGAPMMSAVSLSPERHQLAQSKADVQSATQTVQTYTKAIGDLQAALAKPAPSFSGPDITPDHKDHEKKPKDDLVQRLEEELAAKKVAWDLEQDAQNTAQQFSLESEKAYWAQALQLPNLSVKDRLAIEQRYLEASKQLRSQQIAEQIDNYRREEAEAGKSAEAKLDIVRRETAYIGQQYGLQSTQYQAALVRERDAEKAVSAQKLEIAKATQEGIAKLEDIRLAGAEADAKFLVEIGRKTQLQLLADERDFENQRYVIALNAARDRLAAAKTANDPVAITQANQQIEQLELQHQQKLTQIDRNALLERKRLELAAADQISSSWAQSISRLITLQAGFMSTLKSLYQGLQQAIGGALENIIEKWLQKHLEALILGRAQQSVTGVAEVASNAAVAGSAAWASTAAIPIVGPELAPAAAAAAYAGAMAFAPLASAAGGWDIPAGVNPVTQLHKREMVLPERFADVIRGMAEGKGGGRDGGFHYHDHGGTMTPAQIMANKETLVKVFKMAHRQGAFQ